MQTLKIVGVLGYLYDPGTTTTAAIVTPKPIDVIVTYHRNQRGLSVLRWLIGIIHSMRSATGNAGCLGLPLRIKRLVRLHILQPLSRLDKQTVEDSSETSSTLSLYDNVFLNHISTRTNSPDW
jgi:hypothetical protein